MARGKKNKAGIFQYMSFDKILISDFVKNLKKIFKNEEKDSNLVESKPRRKRLKFWLMSLLGLSLFVILLSRISFSELENVFSRVNIGYFLLAVFLGISSTVFKTIRFANFFPPGPKRRIKLYGAFGFLRFIYYLLPFNSGEIVYLGVLKKYRFAPTISETAPTWIFLRVTDIIALTMWFIFTLSLSDMKGGLYGEMYSIRWLLIGISAILIIIILIFPLWIPKISFKIKNKWLKERLNLVQAGFKHSFGFHVFTRTILISLVIWTILISSQIFSQFAFNTPLNFSQAVLVSITIYCLSLLPINTPLNIGTDEAAWTGAMVLAGVDAKLAISIAISIRVIGMLILISDGLIGFSLFFIGRNSSKTKSA